MHIFHINYHKPSPPLLMVCKIWCVHSSEGAYCGFLVCTPVRIQQCCQHLRLCEIEVSTTVEDSGLWDITLCHWVHIPLKCQESSHQQHSTTSQKTSIPSEVYVCKTNEIYNLWGCSYTHRVHVHHTMETYGQVMITPQLILNFTTRWNRVVSFRP